MKSNRSLKPGSHPKKCTKPGEDDESCLLKDDSYSEYACGMNDKSYCKPTPSDKPFDEYWSELNALFFNYDDMLYSYYI